MLKDTTIRHAAYVAGILTTIFFACWPYPLALIHVLLLSLATYYSRQPLAFTLATSTTGAALLSLCAKTSSHTFWFAHSHSLLSIPPWVPPACGLASMWTIDAHRLTVGQHLLKVMLP